MTTLAPPRAGLESDLEEVVGEILHRHPAVGLAVAVVHPDGVAFVERGFADLASERRVSAETVFRIGSITKTMTAVSIMQLVEAGLIDLDAPVGEYLRAFRLRQRDADFRPPTLRHLLTHTSGIPDARHLADLLHVTWGPWDGRPPVHSVPFGRRLSTLADYYRDGLEVVAQPGSTCSYSNHAFATLGQVVEDVSGVPLARYLRERLFEPLGMLDTDLVRSERVASRLAVGYGFGPSGPRPVPDRDWIGGGGGGVYSTAADLVRYAGALLHGGANEHGRVLQAGTLASMFEVQYQTHPALPAMGLAFFRSDLAGHRVLSHDGILPGFNSHLSVVPEDEIGLVALTNGSSGAMRWIPGEMEALQRRLLGVAVERPRVDIPHHPEVWSDICGCYVLPPRIGDLRGRVAMGPGMEVLVQGGRPVLRLRWPFPGLRRGVPLVPDDPDDPCAFRLDLTGMGLGRVRARFRRDAVTGQRAIHTDLGGQPISFVEAAAGTSVWWIVGAACVTVASAAAAARRRRSRAIPRPC
jgi:CubicO group peptidase (beta-lactamase class C family)